MEKKDISEEMEILETKTKKKRKIILSPLLVERLIVAAGNSKWCFPGKPQTKHINRNTIGKQIRKASKSVPALKSFTISMHSARKNFAIDLYKKSGNLEIVQKALNHAHVATTLLYIHGAPVAR